MSKYVILLLYDISKDKYVNKENKRPFSVWNYFNSYPLQIRKHRVTARSHVLDQRWHWSNKET